MGQDHRQRQPAGRVALPCGVVLDQPHGEHVEPPEGSDKPDNQRNEAHGLSSSLRPQTPNGPWSPFGSPHGAGGLPDRARLPVSRSPAPSGSASQIAARQVDTLTAIVRYGTLWRGGAQLEYGGFGVGAPFIPKDPTNLAQGGLHLGRRQDGRDHVAR